MADTRIGVVGCGGRMGRMLIAEIAAAAGCAVAGGAEAPGSAAIGHDIGELAGIGPLGLTVGSDRAALFAAADAVIDFTVPARQRRPRRARRRARPRLVIGTTGLDRRRPQAVQAGGAAGADRVGAQHVARRQPCSPISSRASPAGSAPTYDIEILEMHHRNKIDAPSGTALALGRAAAAGRGIDARQRRASARDGHTGARPARRDRLRDLARRRRRRRAHRHLRRRRRARSSSATAPPAARLRPRRGARRQLGAGQNPASTT